YQALLIAVRKDSPIKTMADLIAAAKANPGKLTYSSVGVGSTQHLAGALLCAMAGIDMTPVSATVPGYDVKTWVGLAAPKGTPADVVKKINDATRAGLADKDTIER